MARPAMHSYRLNVKGNDQADEGVIQWDDEELLLLGPDGQSVLQIAISDAHRLFDVYDLFAKSQIGIPVFSELPVFTADDFTIRSLHHLVEEGYRRDAQSRLRAQRGSLFLALKGGGYILVGGGLFGLYCWWALQAPNPPPGNWLRWVGPLVHFGLIVLMAWTLVGPVLVWRGLREYLILRRFE